MVVNHAIEELTLVTGWFLSNAIWEFLVMTGVAYLPFAYIFVTAWDKARTQGDDEGNDGEQALKVILQDFIKVLVVLTIAVFPMMTYQSSGVVYGGACVDPMLDENDIASQEGRVESVASIAGGAPSVPLLWVIVHNLSSAAAKATIDIIPCEKDYRFYNIQFASSSIKDPHTQRMANMFVDQCYVPAMSDISSEVNAASGNVDAEKDLWLGSNKMQDHYRRTTSRVEVPMDVWEASWRQSIGDPTVQVNGYDPRSDAKLGSPGTATPGCDVFLGHLRRLVLAGRTEQDVSMMDSIAEGWANTKVMLRMSDIQTEQEKKEMAYLSQMITPGDTVSDSLYQNKRFFHADGLGDAVAGGFGVLKDVSVETVTAGAGAWEVAAKNTEVYMLQKMLPMGLAVVQMLFYMMIPLVLVLQAYRVATVVILCGVTFALEYMNVPFALSVWADKVFMAEFMDVGMFLNPDNVNAQVAMAQMANLTYLSIPLAYVGILGLAGIKISMTGDSMRGAGTASGSVASTAGRAVTTAAKAAAKAA